VLPPETTLRVRVVAPRELRIATVEAGMGLTREEATRWVDQTEHERGCSSSAASAPTWPDPLAYDLVVNSGRFTIDECVDLIAAAARALEGRLRK